MAFSGLFAFFYIGTSFLTSYGTATLHLPRNEVLAGGIVASVFFAIATVGSGWVCDRVGRKRALVGAGIIGLVWALVMFSVLDAGGSAERGSAVMFTIGLSMTLVVVGFMFGPAGSFLPSCSRPGSATPVRAWRTARGGDPGWRGAADRCGQHRGGLRRLRGWA